jgi:hypothetical protein
VLGAERTRRAHRGIDEIDPIETSCGKENGDTPYRRQRTEFQNDRDQEVRSATTNIPMSLPSCPDRAAFA